MEEDSSGRGNASERGGDTAEIVVLPTRSKAPIVKSQAAYSNQGGLAVSSAKPLPKQVTFNRAELSQILKTYGRRVAEGEWRDYAIDFQKDRAVFSIFKRTSEMPVYRIEKDPKLARKQGMYSVVTTTGMVLKRGWELSQVLKVLEAKRHLRVVD